MNDHNPEGKKLLSSRLLVKKIAVLLICLSAILATLPGCDKVADFKNDIFSRFASEKELESAVKTVEVFFDHIINQDYEQAYNYVYKKEGSNKTLDDFTDEFSDMTRVVSIEINWVEVKNNIAIVGIDLIDTYDDEEKIYKNLQVSLVKDEDSVWKINFWQQY